MLKVNHVDKWNELKKWLGHELGNLNRTVMNTRRLQEQILGEPYTPQDFFNMMDEYKRILKMMAELEKTRENRELTEKCCICKKSLMIGDAVIVDKYLDYYHVKCYHDQHQLRREIHGQNGCF
jgi:hypothetical protein